MAGWSVRFGRTTAHGESAAVQRLNASASALPLASIICINALWSAGFAFATDIAEQHSSEKSGKQVPAVVVLGMSTKHEMSRASRVVLSMVMGGG
jgi:hypothetical protein